MARSSLRWPAGRVASGGWGGGGLHFHLSPRKWPWNCAHCTLFRLHLRIRRAQWDVLWRNPSSRFSAPTAALGAMGAILRALSGRADISMRRMPPLLLWRKTENGLGLYGSRGESGPDRLPWAKNFSRKHLNKRFGEGCSASRPPCAVRP